MNQISRLALAAVALMLAGITNAQQPTAPAPQQPPDFSKVQIQTTNPGRGTYMLEGQGDNITVAVADDGVILVDGQFGPLRDKIKAAVAAVSIQPIRYFADANVLSTGDIVTLGRYPTIDFANGGTINGMIAAVDAYIKLSNGDTEVVPGHGPLTNRVGLESYRATLVTARDRVAKLIAEGKSAEEAVALKPLADVDAKVGANDQASGNIVRLVYYSLKPKA